MKNFLKKMRFFIFFENFHDFWKFWFFRKFSLKIPTKIFDLKNFRKKIMKIFKIFKNLIFSRNFQKVALTFFIFKKFLMIFFIERCKNLLRIDCAYLERLKNEMKKCHHRKYFFLTEKHSFWALNGHIIINFLYIQYISVTIPGSIFSRNCGPDPCWSS